MGCIEGTESAGTYLPPSTHLSGLHPGRAKSTSSFPDWTYCMGPGTDGFGPYHFTLPLTVHILKV